MNVPSYDYYANTLLDPTIDPEVVSDSRTLLKFGRLYSMSGGDIPRVQTSEMVAIASRKLTRKMRREFERVLFSRTTNETTAIMTAVLACCLALYTGPYVQLTHELVAFHMMTVQKSPETLELHGHLEACDAGISSPVSPHCQGLGSQGAKVLDLKKPRYMAPRCKVTKALGKLHSLF